MSVDDIFSPQMPLMSASARDYAERVMAAREAGVRGLRRVVLSYGDDPAQACDVWNRPGMTDAPVLVFWHGGGWTNGYRQWSHHMARHVVDQGMIFVTPGYRLAPRHRMPAIESDAFALVRHLATHVEEYGGSAKRIYVSGHSAGGHIAALVALRSQHARGNDGLGIDPACIAGCLPISGILDLHHPAPVPDSLEDRVYSMVLDDAAHDSVFSPICWTAGNAIPILLTCGEHDSGRVLSSNRRAAALLELQAGPVTLNVLPGRDHYTTHLELADASAPWYGQLRAFVASRAGGPSPTTKGST